MTIVNGDNLFEKYVRLLHSRVTSNCKQQLLSLQGPLLCRPSSHRRIYWGIQILHFYEIITFG